MPPKKTDPKMIEVSVSVSYGVKANLGNYESGDAHVSRSEKWDVAGLTSEQIDAFWSERYRVLSEEMSERIEREYTELKG